MGRWGGGDFPFKYDQLFIFHISGFFFFWRRPLVKNLFSIIHNYQLATWVGKYLIVLFTLLSSSLSSRIIVVIHYYELYYWNRVNRYRGLTSSATVMQGWKPSEATIYIDSVPVTYILIYDWCCSDDGMVFSALIFLYYCTSFSKMMGSSAYFEVYTVRNVQIWQFLKGFYIY